jgi:uncharacterized membrane protein YqhA
MSTQFFINSPELSPAEERAYRELDLLIDEVEADPDKNLAIVLKDKAFSELMAKYIGVEVASLYVAPPTIADLKPIDFLSVPGVEDLPMFMIAGYDNDTNSFAFTNVDSDEVSRRRQGQTQVLQTPQQRLSAELCARHLQNRIDSTPNYLLLPFGEILTYCFLYHILQKCSSVTSVENISWPDVARRSWEELCDAHKLRRHTNVAEVPVTLLNALKDWYSQSHTNRSFLGIDRINAVYALDPEMANAIGTLDVNAQTTNEDFPHFLEKWAKALYDSLLPVDSEDLMRSFWRRTLINPHIEELLCTRGLYVTIIRSPLTTKDQEPSIESQAYAICTLVDTSRLESCEPRRKHLDGILRRVAREGLGKYDYHRLQRTAQDLKSAADYHSRLLELLQAVSNPNIDSEQLMEQTATLFQYVGKAERILIAWSDVGVHMLSTGACVDDDTKETWFGYLTTAASDTSLLANNLPSDNGVALTLATNKSCANLLTRICNGLQIKDYSQHQIQAFSLGDRQGVVLLFSSSMAQLSRETTEQLTKIALTLGVGMELPFRNAIGRGFFSGILRGSCHPITSSRNLWSSFLGWKGNRRMNAHRILDWFVASIVEFNRIGFVAVGVLFSYLVFYILWRTAHNIGAGEAQEKDIAQTLGSVERTVMAFSICLAATGVIFLLRPGMSAGQPKWMKRFQELGTLEQTLVRLAAMVLTIHVLKVALEADVTFQITATTNVRELWMAMQPTLFHIVVYLMVLVGLVFLSKFLLHEDDGESEKRKNRSMFEAAREKKPTDVEVDRA